MSRNTVEVPSGITTVDSFAESCTKIRSNFQNAFVPGFGNRVPQYLVC